MGIKPIYTHTILHTVDHRSYPLPDTPWIMLQVWHELLFAHWPIAPETLRSLMPAILELDTFEKQGWIGIVPFRASTVRPRGLPAVAPVSEFLELNVRTYVTVNGRPGVYFFSLDASSPLAVAIARSVFHLPYFNASMQLRAREGALDYRSRRIHRGAPTADYDATYRPTAPVTYAEPGTLEHWLTERYCLYTVVGQQMVYRGEIHHAPWPLQAAELETRRNTMALSHGIHLPDTAPLLHYAHRQETLFWPLKLVHKP